MRQYNSIDRIRHILSEVTTRKGTSRMAMSTMYLCISLLFPLISLIFASGTSDRPSKLHPSALKWEVFLNAPIPAANFPRPNVTTPPIASTLIYGQNEAVLVDTPITANQTELLADWIQQTIPDKRLTTVYITHGHGDHFFGLPTLQRRFPGLRIVGTEHTVEHIQQQLQPATFDEFWAPTFPGQIDRQTENVEALPPSNEINLEGHILRAVEVGQSDTYNTTILHVPDLDLVVAGDVVYGKCFLYFVESNTPTLRTQWLKSIDEIIALQPKIVIPSHKSALDGYSPTHLHTTKSFIRFWERAVKTATNADELFIAVTTAFPDWIGEFPLTLSTVTAFPA
jgi:glyoxylase-like metal-dependent hydrolase (beta-lactamase superfamily II)